MSEAQIDQETADIALMMEKEIDKRVAMALVRLLSPYDKPPILTVYDNYGDYDKLVDDIEGLLSESIHSAILNGKAKLLENVIEKISLDIVTNALRNLQVTVATGGQQITTTTTGITYTSSSAATCGGCGRAL